MTHLSAILNGLTPAILVIDKNRQILVANQAAEALFGSGRTGQNLVTAVRHPKCLNCVERVFSGQKKAETILSLDAPVATDYRLTVTDLGPSKAGKPRAVLSFDDLSPAQAAEQMRSNFAANIGRELRAPLKSLSGFVKTLKASAPDDKTARDKLLPIIDREAQRMSGLIADLLSLSKVEVNERVRPTENVDIGKVVGQVIKAQSQDDKTRIIFDHPSSPCTVAADAGELSRVFENLLENAVKFGGDADINIKIELREHASRLQGPALAVSVKDQGCGISAHHIPRLCERFYQVENTQTDNKDSTGLGLAIVKHILSRHRGRLQIKSDKGKGSTFTVLLPASSIGPET